MGTNPTTLHETSGSRKKAVLLIVVLTIAFPIIFLLLNYLAWSITGFMEFRFPRLTAILDFIFDNALFEEILNPVITLIIEYLLVIQSEKICQTRQGARYFGGAVLAVLMILPEILIIPRISWNIPYHPGESPSVLSVIILQLSYVAMLFVAFKRSGTVWMFLRKKYAAFFLREDDKGTHHCAVIRSATPVVKKKGSVDEKKLARMYSAVLRSVKDYSLPGTHIILPCEIVGIKALCQYRIILSQEKGVVSPVTKIERLSKEESIPIEIINMMPQVKA